MGEFIKGILSLLFMAVVGFSLYFYFVSYPAEVSAERAWLAQEQQTQCMAGKAMATPTGNGFLDGLAQTLGVMVNIADPAKAQRFCACYANTSAADVSSVMEQYRIPYVLSKITF